jgi:hypothetical protein
MTNTVCIVILNQAWPITIIAVVLYEIEVILNFGLKLEYNLGVILPQQILYSVVLVSISYFCEKKFKEEFLQAKKNEKLTRDFKHALEIVPEAILLYDPDKKEVVMTNTEMSSLLTKYEAPQ